VPVRQLVVGDVVQLSQGDRVPADCIVLDEMNMEIDESAYGRGRANMKKEES
jgi:P-type E1-E2 ATPase